MKFSYSILLLSGIFFGNISIAQSHVKGGRETYRYWAGEEPDSSKQIINGEYWSYSHFTKEYKMYLEIKVKPSLASFFITDNNLTAGKYQAIQGAPAWFKPPRHFEIWSGKQRSLYFINLKTGHMFLYEVQL